MQKLFILAQLLLSGLVNCQDSSTETDENLVFQYAFIIIFILIVIIIIRAIITKRRPLVLVGLVEEAPPQNIVVHQVPTNQNLYPPQQTVPPAQNLQYQEWIKQQQMNQPIYQQQYQQQQLPPPQYAPQMNQNYYQQPMQIQYQQNVQAYPNNPVYPQQGIPISQPQGYPK